MDACMGLVAEVVRNLAATGDEFSVNDVRARVPVGVRNIYGNVFKALVKEGVIAPVPGVFARASKGRRVTVYRGVGPRVVTVSVPDVRDAVSSVSLVDPFRAVEVAVADSLANKPEPPELEPEPEPEREPEPEPELVVEPARSRVDPGKVIKIQRGEIQRLTELVDRLRVDVEDRDRRVQVLLGRHVQAQRVLQGWLARPRAAREVPRDQVNSLVAALVNALGVPERRAG